MQEISEQNNFYYLTAGLVLMLMAGAVVEHYPGTLGARFVSAFTVITLALGVWGFRGTRSLLHAGILFTLVALGLVISGVLLDLAGLRYSHLLVLLLFFIWAAWVAMRQVLFTGSIDGNKIVGAICIYLLLGFIWAMLYLFIAELTPSAFKGFEQGSWHDNLFHALYFSFVTLTTLGYGDITPVLPVARFLAFMEAIVGVFYTAILVASLVGVRMAQLDRESR